VQSARPLNKQSPTGVSDLRGLSRQTSNTGALRLVVARERTGAGRRAGGWAGRYEPGIGCGTRFLNRLAFQRGKQAEKRDFRERSTREKTFKWTTLAQSVPLSCQPGIGAALVRRGFTQGIAVG